MNKLAYILIITFFSSLLMFGNESGFMSSSEGKVMYIYRNDSERLTTILFSQIKEMKCSKEDSLEVIHDDFVTQVIETEDSLYRIPIPAIDSICFHTLPPLLLPETVMIEADIAKHIVAAEGNDLVLDGGVVSEQLPAVGSVIFSYGEEGILEDGFAGRVIGTEIVNDQLRLKCEEVGIEDVFERFYAYYDGEGIKEEKKRMQLNSYSPIHFDIPLFLDTFGAENGIPLPFDEKERDDLQSWGLGVNRFDGWIYPKYLDFNPVISLWKPFFYIEELHGNFEAEVELNMDVCIGLSVGLNKNIKKLTDLTSRLGSKLTKINKVFQKSPIKLYCGPWINISLSGDIALGEFQRYTAKWRNYEKLSYWDLISPVFQLRNATLVLNDSRCKYAFGEVAENLGLSFNFTFGRLDKHKTKYDKETGIEPAWKWYVDMALGYDVGWEVTSPFYLDKTSIELRDDSFYELWKTKTMFGSYINPYLKLNVGMNFEGVLSKMNGTKNFFEKKWTEGLWNVPLFSNGYFDKERKIVRYDISRDVSYDHSVGVAIYDEVEWERSGLVATETNPMTVYYQSPYGLLNRFESYEIDLPTLKPFRKYTIYPIVDQKVYFDFIEPIPMLASPAIEVMLDMKPLTKNALVDKAARSVQMEGALFPMDALDGIEFEAGIEYGLSDMDPVMRNMMPVPVDKDGKFTAYATDLATGKLYAYRAYLKIEDSYYYGDEKTFIIGEDDLIDLGLSVRWRNRNIGAEDSAETGDYYAWGETQVKEIYTWDTYFDSPYNGNNNWTGCALNDDISATDYDAAFVKLGENYRMPTNAELQELIDECEWVWTETDTVNGFTVIGPNGNSIFLPAGGAVEKDLISNIGQYGGYWSSTPMTESSKGMAGNLYFFGSSGYTLFNTQWSNRYTGRNIRPVENSVGVR